MDRVITVYTLNCKFDNKNVDCIFGTIMISEDLIVFVSKSINPGVCSKKEAINFDNFMELYLYLERNDNKLLYLNKEDNEYIHNKISKQVNLSKDRLKFSIDHEECEVV